MSQELRGSIVDAFRGTLVSSNGIDYYSGDDEATSISKFMEIPLKGPIVEIPVFTFNSFPKLLSSYPEADLMAVQLYSKGRTSKYKTAERAMRDLLKNNFHRYRLVEFNATQGGQTYTYYVTHGAIFTSNFIPIMMCSWLFEKCFTDEGVKFKCLKPIVRVEPAVYLQPHTSMDKFIAKKMINTSLDNLHTFILSAQPQIDNTQSSYCPSVLIETNPFQLREISSPDINTSNQTLLQTAAEHLDELLQ